MPNIERSILRGLVETAVITACVQQIESLPEGQERKDMTRKLFSALVAEMINFASDCGCEDKIYPVFQEFIEKRQQNVTDDLPRIVRI